MALSDLVDSRCPKRGDINASIQASSFPSAPTPDLFTEAPLPQPGVDDIEANWVNSSGSPWRPRITWYVNGGVFITRLLTAGANADILSASDSSGLSPGDDITARIRYSLQGTELVVGTSLSGSDLPTGAEVNAAINMSSSLTAQRNPTKKQILDNCSTDGVNGGESNTVTFT